jgi:hypothetical protein
MIPPFVPMDLNMYFVYYFGINGPDPLIFGRNENYAIGITQTQPMPLVEPLEHIEHLVKISIMD